MNDLIILNADDVTEVTGLAGLAGITEGKTAARTAGTREDFRVFMNCISLEMVSYLILIYNF